DAAVILPSLTTTRASMGPCRLVPMATYVPSRYTAACWLPLPGDAAGTRLGVWIWDCAVFWATTGSSVSRVRKYPTVYTERTMAELRPIRPSVIRLRLRQPSPARDVPARAIASAGGAGTCL